MRNRPVGVLLPILFKLYEGSLILYPASFRQAYGPEMAQVFRTACRETQQRAGVGGLVVLCSRTVSDLVWSGLCEWMTKLRSREMLMQAVLSLTAVLWAAITNALQGGHDADDTALAVLLAGSFLYGVVRPKGAWWWALLIGLGLSVWRVIGQLTGFTLFYATDAELPLVFVPTVIGAYAGAVVRRLANWLWDKSALSG
jgi:hypothetical protein